MAQMTYEETMTWGALQYADVLGALREHGHLAEFTQTGGMCAALMIPLESGYYVLITDEDDTLSWERSSHQGWWAGVIADPDVHPEADGPISYDQCADGGIPALLALVELVMNPAAWR